MNRTIERMIDEESRILTMKALLETIDSLQSSDNVVVTNEIIEDIKKAIEDFPRFTDYIGRINRGDEMEKIIKRILTTEGVKIPLFMTEKFEELTA